MFFVVYTFVNSEGQPCFLIRDILDADTISQAAKKKPTVNKKEPIHNWPADKLLRNPVIA